MSEIKIKRIVIQLGDKVLELSLEDARELKKVLEDTFPTKEYIPIGEPYPLLPISPLVPGNPLQPVWVDTVDNTSVVKYRNWEVACEHDTATIRNSGDFT